MSHKAVVSNDRCVHFKNEACDNKGVTNGDTDKVRPPVFATRFIYNSNVNPAMIEAVFARIKKSTQKFAAKVKSHIFLELELIKFGFPLDFNRACDLGQYTGNHSSAND